MNHSTVTIRLDYNLIYNHSYAHDSLLLFVRCLAPRTVGAQVATVYRAPHGAKHLLSVNVVG